MFLVYSRHTFYTVSFLTFKNIIFSSIGNAFSEICAAAQRRRGWADWRQKLINTIAFDKDHAAALTGGGDAGAGANLIVYLFYSINCEPHLKTESFFQIKNADVESSHFFI